MGDLETIIQLFHQLKNITITGNIILIVSVAGVSFALYWWQKKQNQTMKDYLDLWEPSKIEEQMKAWMNIKTEIFNTNIEQYKSQIERAENKLEEALDIIKKLERERNRLVEKLIGRREVHYDDFVPLGSKVRAPEGVEDVLWTAELPGGKVMKFRFPIPRQIKEIRGSSTFEREKDRKKAKND